MYYWIYFNSKLHPSGYTAVSEIINFYLDGHMSNAETCFTDLGLLRSRVSEIQYHIGARQAYIFLLCLSYSGWIPKDNMQVSGMTFYNPAVFLSSWICSMLWKLSCLKGFYILAKLLPPKCVSLYKYVFKFLVETVYNKKVSCVLLLHSNTTTSFKKKKSFEEFLKTKLRRNGATSRWINQSKDT